MNLSFEHIKANSSEQLKNIPFSQLINALIHEAIEVETDKCEIFHFIFATVVNITPIENFEINIFEPFLPLLEEIFNENFKSIDSQLNAADINTVLQLFCTLLQNILICMNNAESVRSKYLGCLPVICMRIFNKIYTRFNTKQTPDADHGTVLQNTRKAQALLVNVLSSDRLFIKPSADDLRHIRCVLKGMYHLVGVPSEFQELKLMAETWKCFSKLTSTFAVSYYQLDEMTRSIMSTELLDWFDGFVNIISIQITNKIYAISRQQSPNGQTIERNMKINIFNAKILQKLLQSYSDKPIKDYACCVKLLESFYELGLNISSVKRSSTFSILEMILLSILTETYDNENFVDNLFSIHSDGKIYICVEIIKILLDSPQQNHLYLSNGKNNKNILNYLLLAGEKINSLSQHDDSLYKKIVFYATALILRNMRNQQVFEILEDTLTKAMLNANNIIVGCIALDVWLLYASKIPSDVCKQYYDCWLKLSENLLCQCNSSPSKLLIYVFIQSLFDCLPASMQLEIVHELQYDRNMSVLAILGLKRIAVCDRNATNQLIKELNEMLRIYLEVFDTNRNKESYDNLVMCLSCVCQNAELIEKELVLAPATISLFIQLLTQMETTKHKRLSHKIFEFLITFKQNLYEETSFNSL